MNKIHKAITSILLVGVLFLTFPIQGTLGNSETGFDYVSEGDRYEYKETTKDKSIYKDADNGTVVESDSFMEYNTESVVEKVDEDDGYITQVSAGSKSNVTNSTTTPTSLEVNIGGWGTNEYVFDYGIKVNVKNWAKPNILLRTWDNYSGEFDEFEEQLENATDDYDEFKSYSFNIDNDAQTIELEMEYIEADMGTAWNESIESGTSIYNVSVTYNVKEEITLSYDNFIMDEYKKVTTKTVNDVKNSSYLEDNDIVYLQESNNEYSAKLQGFLEKYGLWLGIGVGAVVIAVIAVVVWKKYG
ncbi:MAG: hypothetical protein R6U96_16245 [Promethearchaeia archaeon]